MRYRLLAIALLPMLVILPIFLGIAMKRWNDRFDAMLLSKVDGDLTTANQYLSRLLAGDQASLSSLAQSARFLDVLYGKAKQDASLDMLLAREAGKTGADFLYLVDAGHRVIASSRPFASRAPGAIRYDWPIITRALRGQPKTGIDLFSQADLAAISPQLAGRATIHLIATEKAAPTSRTIENRGMVVHSAVPVTLADGTSAALVSGMLLNRNLRFIDTINALVYHDTSVPRGSHGTASLFLGDVRISTNVRLFEGHRAIGTRVSSAVRSAVLGEGRTWLDSAFVVNDWYISAYQPLVDTDGRRVGMLYVGFLEKPFTAMRREIVLSLAFAFLLVTGLTVPLFLRWASDIFKPLERMATTIAQVESGDLAARTGSSGDAGEIGMVAKHLDGLLDEIQDRDRQLRSWNDELNRRVEERTEHLVAARKQIEDTTKQLVLAEKLATLGEISAGIAHEINNPLAVMQGNLEIIRAVLAGRTDDLDLEFRLVDEQIGRISEIVRKLLQFARPAEYAGYEDRQDIAAMISDTLPLVGHLLKRAAVTVVRDDRARREVRINRTELQQVLVNLMVNAIDAMPSGGTLTLRSYDAEGAGGEPGAVIEVQDTGIGMSDNVLARIFDPFFTTKQRDGNGLGLAICQMLISHTGGTLTASSTPDIGSTFFLWLPEAGDDGTRREGHSV